MTHPIRGESQVMRKPRQKRPEVEEAERLIDIWLDEMVSISRDAGFTGDSMLSRVIEFGGDPPKGSGMDQSNLTMINAIKLLRKEHHDFRLIDNIVKRLLKTGAAKHIVALMVKRAVVGLNPDTDRPYTREDKAWEWGFICTNLGYFTEVDKDESKLLSGYRWGAERCAPRLIKREMRTTV